MLQSHHQNRTSCLDNLTPWILIRVPILDRDRWNCNIRRVVCTPYFIWSQHLTSSPLTYHLYRDRWKPNNKDNCTSHLIHITTTYIYTAVWLHSLYRPKYKTWVRFKPLSLYHKYLTTTSNIPELRISQNIIKVFTAISRPITIRGSSPAINTSNIWDIPWINTMWCWRNWDPGPGAGIPSWFMAMAYYNIPGEKWQLFPRIQGCREKLLYGKHIHPYVPINDVFSFIFVCHALTPRQKYKHGITTLMAGNIHATYIITTYLGPTPYHSPLGMRIRLCTGTLSIKVPELTTATDPFFHHHHHHHNLNLHVVGRKSYHKNGNNQHQPGETLVPTPPPNLLWRQARQDKARQGKAISSVLPWIIYIARSLQSFSKAWDQLQAACNVNHLWEHQFIPPRRGRGLNYMLVHRTKRGGEAGMVGGLFNPIPYLLQRWNRAWWMEFNNVAPPPASRTYA